MDISQINLLDIWESDSAHGFDILESTSSEVDGEYILARVEGPAFFPNTTSKNKVFYPLEAWELAINDPKFVQRLDGRLVYGTIGHDIDINDDTVREGKLSHIVTKVWIGEDGIGRAEYLILNTPPGRILNTLLRAKSKLRVSTKAGGLFEPTVKNGVKVVKADTFRLERIDFVVEPGYMQALPELIESLNTDVPSQTKDYLMDTKVVDILEARIVELKDEKNISESVAKKLSDDLMTIKESLASAQSELTHYKAHGTAMAISESLSELNQYRAIGSVQEIHEALENGEEALDNLTDTVDNLQQELKDRPVVSEDDEDEYKDLGSPEEIKTALTQAIELTDELQQYRDMGTVEEIQQVLDNAGEMTETLEASDRQALCDKYGIEPEVLGMMTEKGMTLDECDQMLSSIRGTQAPTISEGEETEEEKAAREKAEADAAAEEEERKRKEAEAAASSSTEEVSESLSSRLIRQHNRGLKDQKINESAAGGQSTVAKSILSRSARLMTLGRK